MQDFHEELKLKLDAIAARGTIPRPSDWRKTKIGNWDGIEKEAQRIAEPHWWRKPSNQAEQTINEVLRRAGLGRLVLDTGPSEEFENERDRQRKANERGDTPVHASEVAEAQQNKQKTGVDDEEKWKSYLGEPKDDARRWLKDLAGKLDTNARENRGWWGTLRHHIETSPRGARVEDLNPELLELCLKNLCSEE